MNLDDSDEEIPTASNNKRSQRICPFCKRKGHTATRSKKCLQHENTAAAAALDPPEVAFQILQQPDPPLVSSEDPPANNDAEDLDNYEALPLEADSDLDLFEDAGTWSEDEFGNLTRAAL